MVKVTDKTYEMSIFMLFIQTKLSIILWLCQSLLHKVKKVQKYLIKHLDFNGPIFRLL